MIGDRQRRDIAQAMKGNVIRAGDMAELPFAELPDIDQVDGVFTNRGGEPIQIP